MDNQKILLGSDLSFTKRISGLTAIMVIYFFYCYNFSLGIFVKPTMLMDVSQGGFGFDLTQTEQIFAVMSFATIPGTIIFGMLAARIGKKYTLIIIAILIGFATAIPMFNQDSYMLWLVARFTTGLVLGGVFGTAQPLVSMMFEPKYRAKLAALLTSLFSISMIFAGMMYSFFGDANWEVLMWTAIIPPIIGAVFAWFLVPNDIELTKQQKLEAIKNKKKISYLSMYKGKYLYIGILVICLSGLNFIGYGAYSNNATTYFTTELGISSDVAGAIFSLQGTGLLVGYYFWGIISDKFGRKVPLIGMALSGVIVFAFSFLQPENISMFYIMSFTLGFMFGYSGVWGAYYTELFPEEFSSLSAGMSFNGGRLLSTYGLPAVATIAVMSGTITSVFNVGAVMLILGAVIWMLLPETLNKKENK